MTTHYENQRPRTFRDLDPEARMRELASLQTELNKPEPMTHIRLSEWASLSSDRTALLRGGVWGGIHWSKTLGRPQTPSITDGFTIVHEFWKHAFVDAGGGDIRDNGRYLVQSAPSVWDATKTSGEYRVGFFFFAGGGGINPNRLTVKLAPVLWENLGHMRAGYRQLNPLGYLPFRNLGEGVVIPDFEVQHVPYHLERYIQPLGPRLDLT